MANPKRLEMLALYITVLATLQAMGFFDFLRLWLRQWLVGG